MSARDDRNKREAERTHQILTEARAQEHDALIAALVQEYADILARRGRWAPGMGGSQAYAHLMSADEKADSLMARMGAREALLHVAARLGVTDLHARAADVVARGAAEEGA